MDRIYTCYFQQNYLLRFGNILTTRTRTYVSKKYRAYTFFYSYKFLHEFDIDSPLKNIQLGDFIFLYNFFNFSI